ncbi:hypothetical protein GCM10007859_12870 [Brevundimonas denitrificans]|uniref:DUF4440 domain-containing protein n=1 Tax=Brevundimonas denitrificans TaxID=1443434 RepID=A0ABQ6BGU3_9CAUL|nr:DUF4440 domain-containing protein [Brevundimonas denitrificans]GLS01275.1 hypothetical protein GCM10007859_12870 [Brevundimonas denitrificans]
MRTLVFAAVLLSAAPVLAQTPDAAPIVAAERAFAADFPALGFGGSFQKWSRPDSILINGGQAQTVAAVFEGAPLTRQPGEPLIEWWPTFAGVARSGEMGFTTGPAARDQEGYGHYFTVWRRQADGAWRWVYDGGSNASPAGQPGPDSQPRLLPVATVGSGSPEAAMAEVTAVEADLAAAAATDQKAAHLAVLAPEGRLYVAPLPPAEGPDAFAAALDGWPARFTFGVTEGGGASDGGDMVWTYGRAGWTREGQDRTGHYMRLWQKRPEGWRLIMAQLIPAPIAPPPPAGG